MTRTVMLAALLVLGHAAGAAAECTCRYQGGDVIEGQTACIRTANGSQLARCEKFLNNTTWKLLDRACPTAELAPGAGDMLL